jgi:hypothetical protein
VTAVTASSRKSCNTFLVQVSEMIRLTESTRARLMLTHGYTMLALGLALFYIRATMTNLFFYVFGGAFALLLVAGSLLFIAAVDWICAAGLGCHQVSRLRGFLFVSTAAAVCSVLLILYPGATIEMVCYLIAVYALSLSAGKFSLAKAWKGSRREQVIMYLLAVVALGFSAALVGFAGNDDRESLSVLAGYSLFMGFQMLLTMHFLTAAGAATLGQASPRKNVISVTARPWKAR